MEKKNRNEELQSRREFFKKAAKGALPVVAVLAMSSNPVVAKATEAMGCTIDVCTATCAGTCKGTCRGCAHSCSGTCMSGCSSSSRY